MIKVIEYKNTKQLEDFLKEGYQIAQTIQNGNKLIIVLLKR